MKFNTAKLQLRIAANEETLYKRYCDEIERAQRDWDTKFERWQTEIKPRLRVRLIDALRVLDNEGTLTTADVPDRMFYSMSSGGMLWPSHTPRPADPKAREDWELPEWFVQLREFMSAVEDEQTTSYALEKSGLLKYVARLR